MVSRLLLVAVLLSCIALTARAAPGDILSILNHEQPSDFSFSSAAPSSAGLSAKPSGLLKTLSFTAYGRAFVAELEPNLPLVTRLSDLSPESLEDVELMRGTLPGQSNSWVRISVIDGRVSGMVWDGIDLYGIDTPSAVLPLLTTPGVDIDGAPVVFRWSDTVGVLTDEVLDLLSGGSPPENLVHVPGALTEPPTRRIDIGVIADSSFQSTFNVGSGAELLARMNIVDGLFSEQVGVQINVAEMSILGVDTDPFTTSAAHDLLSELANHKQASGGLREQGLVHLFTGRDLDGSTVGSAYVSSICHPRVGVGLTQGTFGTVVDSVIAAHEFGHSFGAPHDGEAGSVCAQESSDFLMAPSIGWSDQFSQCSVAQMTTRIQSATCLQSIVPSDVSIRKSFYQTSDHVGQTFHMEYIVTALGPGSALGVDLAVEVGDALTIAGVVEQPIGPESMDCSYTASSVSCKKQRVGIGYQHIIVVSFNAVEAVPTTIRASVATANDPDFRNNVDLTDLNILNLSLEGDNPNNAVSIYFEVVESVSTEPVGEAAGVVDGPALASTDPESQSRSGGGGATTPWFVVLLLFGCLMRLLSTRAIARPRRGEN